MSASGSVYFIKHAAPKVDPASPAEQWTLSDAGCREAEALAREARGWDLAAIYSSVEPKASATAGIIGDALGLQVALVDGLQELRAGGWIGNADEFNDTIRAILEQPDERVRGAESGRGAAERFAGAMDIVLAGPLPAAVVSHGRVLAAYLAPVLGFDAPFKFWRSMPLGGWARVQYGTTPAQLVSAFSKPS